MNKNIISFIIIRGTKDLITLSYRFKVLCIVAVLSSLLLVALITGLVFLSWNYVELRKQAVRPDKNSLPTQPAGALRDELAKENDSASCAPGQDQDSPEIATVRCYADDSIDVYSAEDTRRPYPDQGLVLLNDLKFVLDRQGHKLAVSFKMSNQKTEDRTEGYCIVLGKTRQGKKTVYSVFPDEVSLHQGEIDNFKNGFPFSILRFKEVSATLDVPPGELMFVKIYVFSRNGELVFFRPFQIKPKNE